MGSGHDASGHGRARGIAHLAGDLPDIGLAPSQAANKHDRGKDQTRPVRRACMTRYQHGFPPFGGSDRNSSAALRFVLDVRSPAGARNRTLNEAGPDCGKAPPEMVVTPHETPLVPEIVSECAMRSHPDTGLYFI